MMNSRLLTLSFALVGAVSLFTIGCGGPGEKTTASPPPAASPDSPTTPEHSHAGWWCDEHGVPEAECALCDTKLAAEFQKKGDWCQDHNRPATQCFVCKPELANRFAAKYEAKYGKKPPQMK